MINLAPQIPPINYYKSIIECWRIVDNQVIVRGYNTSKTVSLNPILQVPIEYLTDLTTIPEARAFLYALIAEGGLAQSEIDAIYFVFPPQ